MQTDARSDLSGVFSASLTCDHRSGCVTSTQNTVRLYYTSLLSNHDLLNYLNIVTAALPFMVVTPELPLKYRRKGCPDFRLESPEPDSDIGSDIDMAHSSPLSATYSSFSDFDNYVPRSPTFCSSSSSAAPSSPIRALYTPEPPSSPVTEPHIASSPKSFWEVAVNYGPELPYKIKCRPIQPPPLPRAHRHVGSRVISSTATGLLPPKDASEDTDEGEMDVASVLLDLKRKVRVSPILAEPPKREEPQNALPPKETAPSTVDESVRQLEPPLAAEVRMEVEVGIAPGKTDERVACSTIDTNQESQEASSTSLDSCALQVRLSASSQVSSM